MKIAISTTVLMLLVACASPRSEEVAESARQYHSVNRSMSRADVYALIGPPHVTLPDGREKWLAAEKQQVAELWLRFGPDGGITEMERHSSFD